MKTLLLFSVLVFVTGNLRAQSLITDRFLGAWTGTGLLYNEVATFSMKWESVLNDQFLQLQFKNRLNSGDFQMQAYGYYKSDEPGKINGFWVDSRGVSFPLRGVMQQDTLTIYWGTPDLEQGRTEYVLSANTSLNVTDYVLRDGEYTVFGEAVYHRSQ